MQLFFVYGVLSNYTFVKHVRICFFTWTVNVHCTTLLKTAKNNIAMSSFKFSSESLYESTTSVNFFSVVYFR